MALWALRVRGQLAFAAFMAPRLFVPCPLQVSFLSCPVLLTALEIR